MSWKNIIRFVGVLPASLVGVALGSFLSVVIYFASFIILLSIAGVLGELGYSIVNFLLIFILCGASFALTNFLSVYFAVLSAPSHKKVVGIIVGLFTVAIVAFLFLGDFTFYSSKQRHLYNTLTSLPVLSYPATFAAIAYALKRAWSTKIATKSSQSDKRPFPNNLFS